MPFVSFLELSHAVSATANGQQTLEPDALPVEAEVIGWSRLGSGALKGGLGNGWIGWITREHRCFGVCWTWWS